MPEKNKPEQLNDELIREALSRDFESVEAPPAEKCWSRVEAGLHSGRSPRQNRGLSWFRYAAVAAAVLLVIALSSVGIMQMTDIASPMVEEAPAEEAPMRAADEEMEALEVNEVETPEEEAAEPEIITDEEMAEPEIFTEEETAEPEVFTGEEVISALPPFEVTADPLPPDWQDKINDNLFFDEAVLLNAGEGPEYQGAIYLGEKEALLWVKSEAELEDMASFIKNLGEHIDARPRRVEVANGYVHFETAGQPGLAWQEADQNQALVVISGSVSPEQLEEITAELD